MKEQLTPNNWLECIDDKNFENLKFPEGLDGFFEIPQDLDWLTLDELLPQKRLYDALQFANTQASALVNYLINNTFNTEQYTFTKLAETQSTDDATQTKDRGTYTAIDALSQLVFERVLYRLKQDFARDLDGLSLSGEEKVGSLTDELSQPDNSNSQNPIRVVIDPVDGTAFVTDKFLETEENLRINYKKRNYGVVSVFQAQAQIYGFVNLPESNIRFEITLDGNVIMLKYPDTANETDLFTDEKFLSKLDNPIAGAYINSRIPHQVQQILETNGQLCSPERSLTGRANEAVLDLISGDISVCAVSGKDLRDQAILEMLATMTTHFDNYRTMIDGQELLVVVNKKSPKYQDIIQQLELQYLQTGLVKEVKDLRSDL